MKKTTSLEIDTIVTSTTSNLPTQTIFSNDFSREIWETTYKHFTDSNIDETFRRIAKAIASVEKEEVRQKWEDKFYDLLCDFKITAGGRIISNAGAGYKGTTAINCFVGTKPKYDQDSLEGIFAVLLAQAQTLKSEGGWGMNFSFIRPRGSFIHGIGVETPGAIKYMELFDKSSDIITSGSGKKSKVKEAKGKIRKGAMMSVLDCWHPDIEEFITAKLQPERLQKFNMSVNCSNEFMDKILRIEELKHALEEFTKTDFVFENGAPIINEKLEALKKEDRWDLIFPDTQHPKYKEEWDGNISLWKEKGYSVVVHKTIKASSLWELIMRSTYNRNDPGVLFLDVANKTHCASYAKDAFIQATNPCLAEGTFVNTPNGYRQIETLKVGEEISTLHPNGYEPIHSIEKHEKTPVFKVIFSDGGEQIATAAHRYHVQRKGFTSGKFVEKLRLDEINIGDFIHVEPTNFKNTQLDVKEYEMGLMFGILLGDGSCGKNFKIATSTADSEYNQAIKDLFVRNGFEFNADDKASDGSKSLYLCFSSDSSNLLRNTFNIPDGFESSTKKLIDKSHSYSYSVGVINGLLATDGNVNLKSNHPQIRFDTCSKDLAIDIRRMLLSIGVHGRITSSWSEGGTIDGREIGREIVRKFPKYTVGVSGFDFKTLAALCYENINSSKQQKIKTALYAAKLSGNSRSAQVLSIESFGEATVYDLHCTESDTWITDGYVQQGCGEQCLPFGNVCNLGSLNMTQFVDVKNGCFDLEKIKAYVPIAVRFLDNVNEYTTAPLPEYVEAIRNRRRIGLGVMGWGSALYMLKVRFASDEAERLKDELERMITHTAVEASIELAIEKGMFRDCGPEKHAEAYFWKQIDLPKTTINKIKKHGIRNSALFSIQPTGNTSILANIVSGGLEPVFLHEYIRTSIVQDVPEHIQSECPKYWEGEFKETELFKFAKEGSDTILRGVDASGVVYKIDKNRGLTKETLCEDYGVRYLKEIGQWNPKANWAVTTEQLSVEEHLRDLKGFAKWLDSSCSKTVNLPNDYPFEAFENTYLDAYKSGVLKGITTYRAGTMTNVLSAKEETHEEDAQSIQKTKAPKRPKELEAELHHFTLNKQRYYVVVGLMNTDPYEVFTGINHNEDGDIYIPKTVKEGSIVKHKRGEYSFRSNDQDYLLTNSHADDTADALTRIISCALRHGSPLEFIVDQLSKTKGPMTTFSKILSRTVKKYIKDGRVSGDDCPNCSKKLTFSEGCKLCISCGYSACN